MNYINELLKEYNIFKDEDNSEYERKTNPFLDDDSNDEYDDLDMDDDKCSCHLDVEKVDVELEPKDVVQSFMTHMADFFKKMDTDATSCDGSHEEGSEWEHDEIVDEDSEDMNDDFENSDEFEDIESSDDEGMEMGMGDEDSEEDENFQGIIRTVRGANLVYKRKDSDGDYSELWIYNIGKDVKHSNDVKRAIIAGTDINPNTLQSDDGSQSMKLYSVGNVQFLELSGLQN